MKFRITRKNGHKYLLEIKRRYWFWRAVCDRFSDHAGDIYFPREFDSPEEAERYVRSRWGTYAERVYEGKRVV